MTYKNDPLMPILSEEINSRCSAYKSLSQKEEGDLLSLNADQKKIIADADRRDKAAFLAQQPNIPNAGVKTHPKYLAYTAAAGGAH